MLISPAEPAQLRKTEIGTVSSLPERYGADFMFMPNAEVGWVGIQRKEIKDYVASIVDGRLAKELAQMQSLANRVLILEGSVRFTNDGNLITDGYGQGQSISEKQWHGLLWSIQHRGLWIEYSSGIDDTIKILGWLETWFKRPAHHSLDRRPGPNGLWGKPTNEEYQRHLVMGLPGVGIELAKRIVDTLGVPFGWKITVEDLMKVEGIGKKKAETIWATLDGV